VLQEEEFVLKLDTSTEENASEEREFVSPSERDHTRDVSNLLGEETDVLRERPLLAENVLHTQEEESVLENASVTTH